MKLTTASKYTIKLVARYNNKNMFRNRNKNSFKNEYLSVFTLTIQLAINVFVLVC